MSRHGSPEFYALLDKMATLHDRKSHDYASNGDPFANYLFAGKMSKVFDNPDDAGFVGRLGEKIYRIANLENGGKTPLNESVEDTELDICVIVALWMAQRRTRRGAGSAERAKEILQVFADSPDPFQLPTPVASCHCPADHNDPCPLTPEQCADRQVRYTQAQQPTAPLLERTAEVPVGHFTGYVPQDKMGLRRSTGE